MNKSILIAALIAVATIVWILSGQFGDQGRLARGGLSEPAPAATPRMSAVRVRTLTAEPYVGQITLTGHTEASRTVDLRAETSGRVVSISARRGSAVRKNDLIVRIAMDDREAQLAEADAVLNQRRIEFEAASTLSKKGFRSDTKLAEAKALLVAAKARIAKIRIDISHTNLRAPFQGILDRRFVEQGDFVAVGDRIATIIDLDPVLVVGYVSEREIGRIAGVIRGSATLVNGVEVEGKVRYIASVADPKTRTFRVELEIENRTGAVRPDITSWLRLPLAAVRAHMISPSALTLADDGTIGVKTVSRENRVVFIPVRIVADTGKGVWLEGLPETISVITVGQEFVKHGQLVRPVFERSKNAS